MRDMEGVAWLLLPHGDGADGPNILPLPNCGRDGVCQRPGAWQVIMFAKAAIGPPGCTSTFLPSRSVHQKADGHSFTPVRCYRLLAEALTTPQDRIRHAIRSRWIESDRNG